MSSSKHNPALIDPNLSTGEEPHPSANQIDCYPISWRWWAIITSPILFFSGTAAGYSYFKASGTVELMTLNSVNILVIVIWAIITIRSLNSPFITLSKDELHIKDVLGGQKRILSWNDIEEIKYGSNHLKINTKHRDNINIPKRCLSDEDYEQLFNQVKREIKFKSTSQYQAGRYGVVMNGSDAYITFDCYGTFAKVADLTGYLKHKKNNKSINRIYICIGGTRKRFIYRLTEKNLANAINDASQAPYKLEKA